MDKKIIYVTIGKVTKAFRVKVHEGIASYKLAVLFNSDLEVYSFDLFEEEK